jgi:isopenicillin N synthase-like dioxygenase
LFPSGHYPPGGRHDAGTITLLFQQPLTGLQVKTSETSDWEHIRVPVGKDLVNSADILSILSSGYFKNALHRVVAPPEDQQQHDRLGLLYFVRPSNRLMLKAVDSPILRRLGYTNESRNDTGIPASEWNRAKVKNNLTMLANDSNAGTSMASFMVKQFHD